MLHTTGLRDYESADLRIECLERSKEVVEDHFAAATGPVETGTMVDLHEYLWKSNADLAAFFATWRPCEAGIQITPEDRADFIGYVCTYYGDHPDGWGGWGHDTTPLTREEVEREVQTLLDGYAYVDAVHPLGPAATLVWDGGSHDREVLANIVLARRHPDSIDGLEHAAIVRAILRG